MTDTHAPAEIKQAMQITEQITMPTMALRWRVDHDGSRYLQQCFVTSVGDVFWQDVEVCYDR